MPTNLFSAPPDLRDGRSAVELGGGELHRFAAATGADLVRIIEDELRRHPVDLVIHLGAEQEKDRLRINQDLYALVLDDLVGRAHIMGILHGIGLTGTAAVLDPDPKSDDL